MILAMVQNAWPIAKLKHSSLTITFQLTKKHHQKKHYLVGGECNYDMLQCTLKATTDVG